MQPTIECVFCYEYVKVIIDLVRDGNVDAHFLEIQHSKLQVCVALTHGRH